MLKLFLVGILAFVRLCAAQVFDPPAVDHLPCNGSLALICNSDEVVAAQVLGVSLSSAENNHGARRPGCGVTSEDCVAPVTCLKRSINMCLWKKSSCSLALRDVCGFQTDGCDNVDLLLAKQFHCIKRSSVLNICDHNLEKVPMGEGYITSPRYPSSYPSACNCSVTIPRGNLIHIWILPRDLPGQDCQLDYVEITNKHDSYVSRICKNSIHYPRFPDLTFHGGPLEITFHSRVADEAKSYQGFALYFKVIDSDMGPEYTILTTPANVTSKGIVINQLNVNLMLLTTIFAWTLTAVESLI